MSSQFADLETLRYEERGSVAWVTLDRPDALNAFTATMQEECRAVWRSLRTNDDIRVVVLTASGDRAFCAGIDRDEPFTALEGGAIYGTSNNFMYDDPGDALGPKANDLWKPVIGAINGMNTALKNGAPTETLPPPMASSPRNSSGPASTAPRGMPF